MISPAFSVSVACATLLFSAPIFAWGQSPIVFANARGADKATELQPTPSCCLVKSAVSEEAEGGAQPVVEEPASGPPYVRTMESYQIPDVALVNQHGKKVRLRTVLKGDEPVAMNFVFTTCTTICPVMTATFYALEKALGAEVGNLRLVSISLDPEYDSPEVLDAYAKQFGAGAGWEFLTGDANELTKVYRAFDGAFGSKFSHVPFTLFSVPGIEEWLRIEGLPSVAGLVSEYRKLAQMTRLAELHP